MRVTRPDRAEAIRTTNPTARARPPALTVGLGPVTSPPGGATAGRGALLAARASAGNASPVAPSLSKLDPGELTQVLNGEQVVHTRKIPGHQWPEVIVYQLVDAKPDEAIGVASHYPVVGTKIHTHRSAEILSKDPPRMKYRTTSETYSLEFQEQRRDDGSYRVSWDRVDATFSRYIRGNITFEPHFGKSLLVYTSGVDLKPGWRPIAALTPKKQLKNNIARVAQSFADAVESAKTDRPKYVAKQAKRVRSWTTGG